MESSKDEIREDLVRRATRDIQDGFLKVPKKAEASIVKPESRQPTIESPKSELIPAPAAQFYSSMFLTMINGIFAAINAGDFEAAVSVADECYIAYEPILYEYFPKVGIPELIEQRVRDTISFTYAKYANVPDEMIHDSDRNLHFSEEALLDIEQTRRRRIEREVLLRVFIREAMRGAFEIGLLSLPTQARFTLGEAEQLEEEQAAREGASDEE